MGGLIKDSTTESDTKVPLLGDLPLVGFLFKQHSTKLSKTNLLLILTPYIISSADDFQRIFERKMREHEEFAAEYYGHRKEFRAHVDYRKKTGPFGRMVSTLRREREKLENGGIGDGSETLVGPDARGARLNKDNEKNERSTDDRPPQSGDAEISGEDEAVGVPSARRSRGVSMDDGGQGRLTEDEPRPLGSQVLEFGQEAP